MHPLVIAILVLVVIGLVQKLFPSKKKDLQEETIRRNGIAVILVAPPSVDVEQKLKLLLSLSANPNLVKIYVAKMCEGKETPMELSNLKTRVATRMHFVRAKLNTPPRLRAAMVRQVLEPHILCLPWYHEVEWGWDDLLLKEWVACADQNAVLTTRLSNRAVDSGYIFISSFDGSRVSFDSAPFASPPSRPEPSIACSAQLLFAPTALVQNTWPSKEDLVDAHEDFALTAFLWMGGARFYSPHNQAAFFEVGREDKETPGSTRFPSKGTCRSRDELWTALGIRQGRLSSRARSGLTLKASVNERYHKIGQTIALQREL